MCRKHQSDTTRCEIFMKSEKRLVIATPVYNRRETTLKFLRSLETVERQNLNIHIIIVDDGSTDGTTEAIRRDYPAVQVIAGDGNLWYTAGINLGLAAALEHNPDYILACCDDSLFEPHCLSTLVECAESHPKSVIGAILALQNQPEKVFQVAPTWDTWYGGWRHRHQQTVWTIPSEPFEVEAIAGNCVLFPVAAVAENGLMDEKSFPQYGDHEYTTRMRKAGWRLLVEPRAQIFCQANTTVSINKMSWRQRYQALWGDKRKQNNLRHRFLLYWFTAPSKFLGIIAWLIYIIRLFSKPLGFNRNWETAAQTDEKPLREIYQRKSQTA